MLYDPLVPHLTKLQSVARYELAANIVEGKDVLDIGCGYGYGSYILSSKARHVFGIDEDTEAISYATARYQRPNLSFDAVGAAEYLREVRSEFDMVTMFEVIEHVARQQELLEQVSGSLRPGGFLVISTPNRAYTRFFRHNPYHVKELSWFEFKEILDSRFESISSFGQGPGALALLPLPYYLLMRLVQLMPQAKEMFRINGKPEVSRTMIVLARNTAVALNHANVGLHIDRDG